MKNRLHDKKAGIAILVALIIISLAEVIYRAVALTEFSFTTSNFGEQLAVIALAATILILTAKGKDRACYICYGAWIGYFVLDQIFELPGIVATVLAMFGEGNVDTLIVLGCVLRILGMVGIVAIGVLLVEYMTDGTICNRVFNAVVIVTILLILGNMSIPTWGAITKGEAVALLDIFNCLYRLTMIFLFTFFAYDSAKAQLKKTKLSK